MRAQTGRAEEDSGPNDNFESSGEPIASPRLAVPPSQETPGRAPGEGEPGSRGPLSAREFDVLYWLSEGKSGGEVAQILKISIGTVRVHIRNINHKLRARNIPHAVAHGFKRGILKA